MQFAFSLSRDFCDISIPPLHQDIQPTHNVLVRLLVSLSTWVCKVLLSLLFVCTVHACEYVCFIVQKYLSQQYRTGPAKLLLLLLQLLQLLLPGFANTCRVYIVWMVCMVVVWIGSGVCFALLEFVLASQLGDAEAYRSEMLATC